VRSYWSSAGAGLARSGANAAISPEQHARRVEVPSGFSLFPGDTLRPPRECLDRIANVQRVTEHPSSGHFAPFEEPEAYAAELREFFRPYRDNR
jgi:pimeloyl-ACP methyl ester carboxylesterase